MFILITQNQKRIELLFPLVFVFVNSKKLILMVFRQKKMLYNDREYGSMNKLH